jgi:nicotinate-nucleotide adenylyltransferase
MIEGKDLKRRIKTGLFFGSFNPVHIGHMAIAEYIQEFTDLSQVWFIVSPQNPFKKKESLLEDHHRLEMVYRAIGDDPRFRVSDIEFRMPKPSYTVDTLSYLVEKYPEREFSMILGADNLLSFNKWKNCEMLAENYKRYVYPRHGVPDTEIEKHRNAELVPAPRIEISSSFIRDAIAAGKSVKYFLPEAVWQYLDEMNFYRKR